VRISGPSIFLEANIQLRSEMPGPIIAKLAPGVHY
jgi:hypothetical protein